MERIKSCCKAGIKGCHISGPGRGVVVIHRHHPRSMSAGVLLQQRLLEDREVCFAGEPIALVVADTRYNAEDAATLVEIDFDILPGAADCKTALADGAPLAHSSSPTNEGAKYTVGFGDVDGAFSSVHLTHHVEVWMHRGGGFAIENRAVVAEYDDLLDMMTIWSATQSPFLVKQNVVDMLGRE